MDLVAIFLLLIVLGFMVLFVTRPFFQRKRIRSAENSPEFSSLLAERERLLTALQELDFDQSLGKIPSEDYPAQRTELLQKGVEVLRQLDTISPGSARKVVGEDKPFSDKPNPNSLLSDDDLEDLVAKRRSARIDKTAGFCPKCGKPVLRSDVFCPSCGSALKEY